MHSTSVLWLFVWLISFDATSSEDTCIPGDQMSHQQPFWRLRVFGENEFVYGFPPDFIGGFVGTVTIKKLTCDPQNEEHKAWIECILAFVPTYCHFNHSQLSQLVYDIPYGANCPTGHLPLFSDSFGTELLPVDSLGVSKPIAGHFGQYDAIRQNKLKEFFTTCASDCQKLISIGGIYLCSYEAFLSIIKGDSIESNILTWDITQKTIFQLYLYWFCQETLPLLRQKFPQNLDLKVHPFCPNPCSIRAGKCSRVPNSLKSIRTSNALYAFSESTCVKMNLGFNQGDYRCICEPGFTWSAHSMACTLQDVCTPKTSNSNETATSLCSKEGTLRCLSTIPEQNTVVSEELMLHRRKLVSKPHCVCRAGYMGHRCHRKMDACIKSPSPGQMPGNHACRVFLGNMCDAQNGTNYYFCHCAEQWGPDNRYPFPNCFRRKSICDRVICRNRGICVGSPDQTTFGCMCEFGWTGPYCEKPDVRQWLPWGPWTICSAPMCGGMGWHSRTRECRVPVNETTGYGRCTGNTVEHRPCRIGCINPLSSYLPMIKLVLMFAACLLLLQLAVCVIYMLLYMDLMQFTYNAFSSSDMTY